MYIFFVQKLEIDLCFLGRSHDLIGTVTAGFLHCSQHISEFIRISLRVNFVQFPEDIYITVKKEKKKEEQHFLFVILV